MLTVAKVLLKWMVLPTEWIVITTLLLIRDGKLKISRLKLNY